MTKRLFSNYSKNKAIALSPPTNPDRLFPTSNSDRPTPPTNQIAYLLKPNSDRSLNTHKPDRLSINKNHQTLGCKF
ncbi:MAG: hypothetical protein ACK6CP_09505 [Pseudanabaena sp.]